MRNASAGKNKQTHIAGSTALRATVQEDELALLTALQR
jgi:hypothetical protein